jgi:hypothetical protein
MPVFRFRLKDAGSGEFRNVAAAAESVDEAAAIIEASEAKKVAFELDAAEAADLSKRLKEGSLSGRDKARLFTHQQSKPYVMQTGKEA